MTRISMKALLGAVSLAAIAAVSLTPAAHAQQPGMMNGSPQATMPAQPTPTGPNGYTNGYGPQQNAYVPAQQAPTQPTELHQSNPAYPGPKIN